MLCTARTSILRRIGLTPFAGTSNQVDCVGGICPDGGGCTGGACHVDGDGGVCHVDGGGWTGGFDGVGGACHAGGGCAGCTGLIADGGGDEP
jgi:hypothetical protein